MDKFYKRVGYVIGFVIAVSVLIALSSIMYHLEFIFNMGSKGFFWITIGLFAVIMASYAIAYGKLERKIKKLYLKIKMLDIF